MKVLFLGCGNMGAAIAAGLLRACLEARLIVVDRDIDRAKSLLPADGVQFLDSLAPLQGQTFDVTVLAVKPQQFAAQPASDFPQDCGLVISIMAGVTVEALQARFGPDRTVRMMPNLPALVSRGMTVGYAPAGVSAQDRTQATRIFEGSGRVEWLEHEWQIDSATAVAGSGPGYVFAFVHHLAEAARAEGLPDALADLLAEETLFGAAALLEADPRPVLDLKRAVTSRHGTTQAGLSVLEMDEGLPRLLRSAVRAARERSLALAQEVGRY
ncbi:pyrroline-5-carboxylate reductase [Frigidibacter sp. MR17.14]|uniref:pyrroline-5-carboxylate reductase n=1 Tax=Frigidibacter sp. MR17.14 TaxID=3126509 RepID=UPI003012F407